jgi:hypothetical protein
MSNISSKENHPRWNKWMNEGIAMFNCMNININKMFEQNDTNDKIIKKFEILGSTYHMICYENEIQEKYKNDIQSDLILWINAELDRGELLQSVNWMPFPTGEDVCYMFLGYRYLYVWNNHYFQLSLDSQYNINGELTTYFILSYYGWKEENNTKIQPSNYFIIPPDNRIPDETWNNCISLCPNI